MEEDPSICSPSEGSEVPLSVSLDQLLLGNFSGDFSIREDLINSARLQTNLSTTGDNLTYDEVIPSQIPAAIMVPTGILLYILSLLTFVGNAMVLHAIRTDKRLQTVSNMFIMSLAIADLTVGVIVMPISAAYAITGDWKFGPYVCLFWLSVDYTASTASIFNLSILSLDRYWSITSPLRYLRRRTKKRALIMIMLAWFGASMWFIPVLGWNQILRKGPSHLPENVCDTEFATNITFKVVTSILNFYIPTALITALYVRIFIAIKQRSKDICKFGAYTASGMKPSGPKARGSIVSQLERHAIKSKAYQGTIINTNPIKRNEKSDKPKNSPSTKKFEFHRLAVVALPLEKKCIKNATELNGGGRIYKANLAVDTKKSLEASSQNHIKKPLSCDPALSVFDGITVKVHYIGDEQQAVGNSSETNSTGKAATLSKNGVINSSKELLLGLEEKRKKEVTTVPLRQPLCANYKSIVTSTTRQNSFMDHHSHFHHHRSSERHSGHLQCYRSRKVCVPQSSGGGNNRHQYSENGSTETLAATKKLTPEVAATLRPGSTSTATSNKSVPSGNSSMKRNGGINANSSSIHNATKKGNTAGEQNASETAKKANPKAVLANEKKAATQLGVIVGAFIICFLPYFTLFMVVAYCGNDQCVNPTVFTITIWFGYFNSTLNPILYPLCNANFKTAFKRMLRMDSVKENKNELNKNGAQGCHNGGAGGAHPTPAIDKNHSPSLRQSRNH